MQGNSDRDPTFDGFNPANKEVTLVREMLDLSDISLSMGLGGLMLVDFFDHIGVVEV